MKSRLSDRGFVFFFLPDDILKVAKRSVKCASFLEGFYYIVM